MPDFHKTSVNQLMGRIIAAMPSASLLVICRNLPEFCLAHQGRLSVICRSKPAKELASRDLSVRVYATDAEMLGFIAGAGARNGGEAFDHIHFHANHAPLDLIGQLRSLGGAIDRHTTVSFADAVPPEFAMAGPGPRQGWYVGEVWMLQHMLSPRDDSGFVSVTPIVPTGLLVMRDVALPDGDAAATAYARLSGVSSGQELDRISPYADPEEVFRSVAAEQDRVLDHQFATVEIAPDTGPRPEDKGFARLVDADAAPFAKPAPAFVEDLSRQGHDVSAILRTPRRLHGVFIDAFDDVCLMGNNTFVVDGRCYFRNTRAPISLDRVNADGTFPNAVTELRAIGGRVRYPRASAPPDIIRGHRAFVTPDEHNNWGMWLIHALPSIIDYIRNRDTLDGVVAYQRTPWQRAFLSHLGIRPEEITQHDIQRRYVVDRLRVLRHGFRDLIVREDERATYREVAESLGQGVTTRFPERIFISRRSHSASGAYRALVNEDELITALEGLGFTAVEPETLALPEQVALFDRAKAIVGLGGAAMFNLVFARPGTPVVTIESTAVFLDGHTNLISSMTGTYGVILGQVDETDPRPSQKRWTLDVTRAVRAIRAFLG